MSTRILVADDDPKVREGLVVLCESLGHRTFEAGSGRETLETARRVLPDVVLLDIEMPEGTGLEILPHLVALEGSPQVVMVTGVGGVRAAVEALRAGAVDFLEKPVHRDLIEGVLERVFRGRALSRERDVLRDEVARLRSGPIVGRSRQVEGVLQQIERVASTPRTTVLVTGESGVGKELVARAIHDASARRERPFVALNCAALAETLLEAELFGYVGGAFSGAHPKGREGLFAAAEGGTLFLDEVGELAPELQAKLLRVLQERVYRRVGATEDRPTDVRIVASTNRDLGAMVEAGGFREDLFYRLNVLSIVVPPLRERREDVPLLAEHFLRGFAGEFGREYEGFTPEALAALAAHSWRGNVRELRNAIERACLHAAGGLVTAEHLGLGAAAAPAPAAAAPLSTGDYRLKSMEEALIRRALEAAEGNRSQTARLLGVNRQTLYNKLRAYGIES
ncbi:MAG: sigma-54-dependent Fis family transcriptional regulator [Planctomycetes bacterium]|nr:sigma-54-dependent Fis family transcriptional regulator [Planctomycetota bacterium]